MRYVQSEQKRKQSFEHISHLFLVFLLLTLNKVNIVWEALNLQGQTFLKTREIPVVFVSTFSQIFQKNAWPLATGGQILLGKKLDGYWHWKGAKLRCFTHNDQRWKNSPAFDWSNLKLLSTIFYQIFVFQQSIVLQKLWKTFLFHLKSPFRSRDILIFVFPSSLLFVPVSHYFRGWFMINLKVYDIINCLNKT